MSSEAMSSPVILLGAARSGTTVLGEDVLAKLDSLCYWGEPNYVWRYGHAYRGSDVLGARDASDSVKRYIRSRFERHLARHGGRRVLEKTPANCLRVPFIMEVFPEAQFIHVVRDGRDVAISAAKEWRGLGAEALDSKALREGSGLLQVYRGIRTWSRFSDRVADLRSLVEIPASTGRLLSFLVRRLFHPSWVPWGPRFPGIWSLRLRHSLIEACAIQWDRCVRSVTSACADLPADRYLSVRYEKLIQDPVGTITTILDFLGLPHGESDARKLSGGVRPQSLPKWPRVLRREEVVAVEGHVGATLSSLDYPLSVSGPDDSVPER